MQQEEGILPVLLKDGSFGVMIQICREDNTLGIQVPGEEEIRWVPADSIDDKLLMQTK